MLIKKLAELNELWFCNGFELETVKLLEVFFNTYNKALLQLVTLIIKIDVTIF